MIRRLAAVVCIGLLGVVLASCGSKGVSSKAESVVDSLAKGDYTAATKDFDSTMQTAMPSSQLGQVWSGLTTQAGAFKQRTATREADESGAKTVYVTCQFERMTLDAKFVFNSSSQISGMWLVPSTGGK